MTIVIYEVTMSKAALKKKPDAQPRPVERTIAAAEFKAKCLRIMDEVKDTGRSMIVTKRGKPVIRVSPFTDRNGRKGTRNHADDFFGRLKGVIEIVGDPDDLIRPAFEPDEWDMLK
jgi:prevent-host-death family protein